MSRRAVGSAIGQACSCRRTFALPTRQILRASAKQGSAYCSNSTFIFSSTSPRSYTSSNAANRTHAKASRSAKDDRLLRKPFGTSAIMRHGGIERPEPGTGIKVTFRDSKGTDIRTVEVNEGDDLLAVAHEYDIDLEGACEGSIACSTCHVILEPDMYDKLEEPGDDENDMLDLAFGLTDTSRLGCQVKVTKELDGMVAQLPSATRNMRVDGSKPTHH
ncbi:ferredoxin [Ceraceosorus bombacis]|uniref:Ferredoxin n=1 Tax=Ceraceosorus bombacis TaxID=401625 RepID=A0A0P1BIK2_9BASI|nr:ferredoxin [Ceraceosorus bombacis]